MSDDPNRYANGLESEAELSKLLEGVSEDWLSDAFDRIKHRSLELLAKVNSNGPVQ